MSEGNLKSIYVNDIDDLLGKIHLIDIRETFECRTGTLKTAVNIPMSDLLESPEKYMNKNDEYYIICRSGNRSLSTCNELMKKGYNVVNVKDGIVNYEGENFIRQFNHKR